MINFGSAAKVRFLLVRDGSTDLDIQGRILGSLDLPLSPTGEAEVQHTAEELSGLQIDAIYCAACQAAKQTAQRISLNVKIKVRVDEKLTNLNCGLWHGKSINELRETQPTLFRQWKEHPEAVRPPQGETIEVVRKRVTNLLKKIRRSVKAGLVVIVAPEPLLSIIRCEINRQPIGDCNSPKCGGWEFVEVLEPAV